MEKKLFKITYHVGLRCSNDKYVKPLNMEINIISERMVGMHETEFIDAVKEAIAQNIPNVSDYVIHELSIIDIVRVEDKAEVTPPPTVETLVWAKAQDLNGDPHWIPAVEHEDGKLMSIIGELMDGGEGDKTPFTECPFEGYKIIKLPTEECGKNCSEKFAVERVLARVIIIPEVGYPIIYMKGFDCEIRDNEYIIQEIHKQMSSMVYSKNPYKIHILNWKVCPVFNTDTYPEHTSDNISEYDNAILFNLFVRYSRNGVELRCIVNAPVTKENLALGYRNYCFNQISDQVMLKKSSTTLTDIEIISIELRDSEVAELPLILE